MGRLFDRVWTWRLLVILLVSGTSVAGVLWWRQLWANKEVVGVALSAAVAAWQWYMERSPGFYTFLAKGKALLTNGQVGYSLSASFDGDEITPATFKDVCDRLYSLGERRQTLSSTDDRLVLKIDGVDVVVKFRWSARDGDDSGHLSCEILEYHAPYDPASAELQNKILPLLRAIEELVGGAEKAYIMAIHFRGENPFLGVYAKHVQAKYLTSFQCEILEPDALQGTTITRKVTVHKQQMDLFARDIHGLTLLLSKHLALSGGI